MVEKTDNSDIKRINNNILNEDINEDYGVSEEENTFRRTESDPSGKDAEDGKEAEDISTDFPKGRAKALKPKHEGDIKKGERTKPEAEKKIEGIKAQSAAAAAAAGEKPARKRSRRPKTRKKAVPAKTAAENDKASDSRSKKNGNTDKNNVKPYHKNGRKTIKRNDLAGTNSRVEKMKHKKQKKKNLWMWIVFGIVLVVVIVALIFALKGIAPQEKQQDSEIAATVNGQPIYMKEIDIKYNSLNPVLQQLYTKEALLNQTIDELLLIQEAENTGIKISQEEVDAEVENFQLSNGLTKDQLTDILAQQNITLEELKDLIKRKLLVRDLLNKTILQDISISDAEIKEYYEKNKEAYMVPEQVKAAHILISVQERTEDEAKAIAEEVEGKITADNFCDLVKEYSEDPGSKSKCGEYTFGRNEMVKEFEEAAFRLKNDEMETVKTLYGYHILKKLDSYPPVQTPLSDVSEQVRQTLYDQAAQKNFDAFLKSLRDKSDIQNYMAENAAGSDAVMDSSGDMVSIDAITGAGDDTSASDEQNPSEATATSGKGLDDFAKCLADNNVKMYGAYWCPHCENNKKLFGDSFGYVTYVECAVEGQPQVQTQACTEAGIAGYPTWVIDGKKYPGEQSLEKLASLSGCTL